MTRSQQLSHVAMSVPEGTLTDEWRAAVLAFYGDVFGWHELESLRRPDRMTLAVGSQYINIRERADAPAYNGYEHFGVLFASPDELRRVWAAADRSDADRHLEPLSESDDAYMSFRLRYLLPLTVEAQFFSTGE
jgi:catechol 2,3-dioxygenase-like lactoylglutathione lyase family enzyme